MIFMEDRNTREQIELEDFVLVNNENIPVFRLTNIIVKPIDIGKNGPVFEVTDANGKRIGISKDDKSFEFDSIYLINLEKELDSKYGKGFFKNMMHLKNLKGDVEAEIIKEQERNHDLEEIEKENKEKNENAKKQEPEQDKKVEDKQEKHEVKSDKLKEKEKQNEIEKVDLEQATGQEIDAFTRIKDEDVINDMKLPSNIDRNSIAVVKVGTDFKLYAKEIGEDGEIIAISDDAYEIDQKNTDEAVRLQGNKEYDESLGTTIKLNRDTDLELSMIMENGQIKVGRVERDDEGNAVVTPVHSDIGYPTEEEKNRADSQRLEPDEPLPDDATLTRGEMDEYIEENVRNEIVKEMVKDRVNSNDINCTREQLQQIIDECDNEYARDNREPNLGPRTLG